MVLAHKVIGFPPSLLEHDQMSSWSDTSATFHGGFFFYDLFVCNLLKIYVGVFNCVFSGLLPLLPTSPGARRLHMGHPRLQECQGVRDWGGAGGLIAKKMRGGAVAAWIPCATIISPGRSCPASPGPALVQLPCQSWYPIKFLALPRHPPGLLPPGSYQPLPVGLAGTAVPGLQPLTLSACTDLGLASGGPGACSAFPRKPAGNAASLLPRPL